jgi:ferredoxin-NADP reductase
VSGLPPTWNPAEHEVLVCRAVRLETADVTTFVLSTPVPRLFIYRAGQFVTIEVTCAGVTYNRCYTLSSTPTRPDLVAITVKRVPGGPVSNWLHDHLRPGMLLPVTAPMGEFVREIEPSTKLLYLSAGSGITPLMSMTRAAMDGVENPDIVFFHSARTPADIVFRSELEYLDRLDRGVCTVNICETDNGEVWDGPQGRLTLCMISEACPDFLARAVFTCGPAGYMASVRTMLESAGFDMARYHQESFSFATLAKDEPEVAKAVEDAERIVQKAPTQGFRVHFSKIGMTIDCAPDETVLSAARKGGMRLPSSCRQGVCGTCKSKLVSGTVDMKAAGGIRPREIAQGLVLLCCSRPTSDLVVER